MLAKVKLFCAFSEIIRWQAPGKRDCPAIYLRGKDYLLVFEKNLFYA